jgi:hypothetical protein
MLVFFVCLIGTASSGCTNSSMTPPLPETATPTDTVAPTETQTALPTPAITPTSTHSLTPFPIPIPQGRIALPYRSVSLAIDDQYIYWLVSTRDRIVRQSLQSLNAGQAVAPETIATTRYPNGRLDLLPMQRNGDWLFFVDCNTPGTPNVWMVRAINIKTGTEKVVAQSQGTSVIYDFSADAGQVAMTLSDWGPNQKCLGGAGDTVLAIAQLATGKREELERDCFDQLEWWQVALSGETLFATRAIPNQTSSDVVQFNLLDGSIRQLSQSLDIPATGLLATQGVWVAWDANGGTLLYNLSSGEHRLIAPTVQSGPLQYPSINGAWLYWTDWSNGYRVVAYNLERQEMFTMALPGENEQVWEPYIYGNLIAWVRVLQFDQTDGHSILEWTELP